MQETAGLVVHIVENHDEVLPYIHKAIASKTIPFKGSTLVHFDSHPDLLSPDINADAVVDKSELYDSTSIADWILPMVYMGHVTHVVWIKPPWARQMDTGRHNLVVGKDTRSGHIRVGTPLPYFMSEVLWVPRKDLLNVSEIPLDVVTLHPMNIINSPSTKLDTRSNGSCTATITKESDNPLPDKTTTVDRECNDSLPNKTTNDTRGCDDPLPDKTTHLDRECDDTLPEKTTTINRECNDPLPDNTHSSSDYESSSESPSNAPPGKRSRLCSSANTSVDDVCAVLSGSLQSCGAWILDIDLDFFSTGNPYRNIFTQDEYCLLQRLYQLPGPQDTSEEALCACCRAREEQLELLEKMWQVKNNSGDSEERSGDSATDDSSVLDQLKLAPTDRNLVAGIKRKLWTYYGDSFIDPDYLHTSGIVSDVPVHISDDGDINSLMKALNQVLHRTMKRPALVTISRSSEDEYTPHHQVEHIQEDVVQVIRSSWQHSVPLTVLHEYLNEEDSPETHDKEHGVDDK